MTSDKWASGAAYDAYMGRWSRLLAGRFVEWLGVERAVAWLDVGCGTGALTAAICEQGDPGSVIGCDPAEAFVAQARNNVTDSRASFLVAGAESLPSREGGFGAIVSGLVLNFLPDPGRAVAALRERSSPRGVIAAYVWDYAIGLEFLRYFWDEAVTLDSGAAVLDEGRRFPLCEPAALETVFRTASLEDVETTSLEVVTEFADFDDYWRPFLGGTGPAPNYVSSLDPARREALREGLARRIPSGSDGRIQLRGRAWAVRGRSV